MNKFYLYAVVSIFSFLVIHGCNDITLPAGAFDVAGTRDATVPRTIEADRIYPREGPVGTEITVFGRGDTFPSGFYRVTFTGGASYEFFQEKATGELKITVPAGARSGPFGFIVGSRPGGGYETAGPGSDGFGAYTVSDPGFRVTGTDGWEARW